MASGICKACSAEHHDDFAAIFPLAAGIRGPLAGACRIALPDEFLIPARRVGSARTRRTGDGALAITDECSLAGIVRAHTALKEIKQERERQQKEREQKTKAAQGETSSENALAPTFSPDVIAEDDDASKPIPHLIIGSELNLTNAAGQPFCTLVALAIDRNGYGNLSELITLARSRADKGSYRLSPSDFADSLPHLAHLKGLPDCVLMVVPQRTATLSHTLRCDARIDSPRSRRSVRGSHSNCGKPAATSFHRRVANDFKSERFATGCGGWRADAYAYRRAMPFLARRTRVRIS